MFQKKDYVFGAILIYLFLIMMVFMLEEKEIIEGPCGWANPCVRFCCRDSSACKEKYIRQNFNKSFLEAYDDENENDTEKYRILIGKPLCTLETITVNDEWSFDLVRVETRLASLNESLK